MFGLPDFSLPASNPQNPNQPILTPAQMQAQALYAQGLLREGSDTSPIRSPWQGAARLAEGLMGGLASGQQAQQAAQGAASQNAMLASLLGGAGAGAGAPSPAASGGAGLGAGPSPGGAPSPAASGGAGLGAGPSPGGAPSPAASGGAGLGAGPSPGGAPSADGSGSSLPAFAGGGAMAPYANAIASIESKGSGDYGALGPQMDSGDRAYGRYQVMGANIPSWTKAATGQAMTPEQFLASPQAQDAVFAQQFGAAVQKFGNPQDAASVWFTGRPLAQAGADASDGYSTNGQYLQKFNTALALQGNQPSPGGGAPGQASVSAPSAMGSAGMSGAPGAPAPVQVASNNPNFVPAAALGAPGSASPPVAPGGGGQGAAGVNPLTGAPYPAGAPAPMASQGGAGPAIIVPGYEDAGPVTRAQANDGDGVPSAAEWDAAAAQAGRGGAGGQQVASSAPGAPMGAVSGSPAPAPAPVAQNQAQISAALGILQNPYASPAAQQIAAAVLQKAANPAGTWQDFQRNGSYWQRNTATGEEKLLQDNSPDSDSYSSVTLPDGRVIPFNKTSGQFGTPVGSPGSYRPMTADEKAQYGVQPNAAAYIGPDGKPAGIGGGGITVNNGADAQSYDQQLVSGLGKAHAALANGVEDAQTRARDIAAMQGALDAIQKNGGTTGFGQQQVLDLKKAINTGANSLGIDQPYDVSDPEFLTKFNRQIAGAQAKGAVGARVTNFEMGNYMKANPGLEMSTTGNQRLLGIQAQIEQRNIAVGQSIRDATANAVASGQKINPVQVQGLIKSYDDAHHISDPVTGQDLTQSYALPEFQGGANAGAAAQRAKNLAPVTHVWTPNGGLQQVQP